MKQLIGVTLGKYAPLHKGHELLIRTAISEMDQVIVIVYNASDVTKIPTEIRANWVRKLFPSALVIIAEAGPQETGYTEEIKLKHENYLKRLLSEYDIHSFYSSEPYGDHVSKALNCRNRVVDIHRSSYPVSSSMIREHVLEYRHMVSEIVYSDIKPRLAFVGGPSTGKSTLVLVCANELQGDYCREYGRDYWMLHQTDHRLSMWDLEQIARGHLVLEDTSARGIGDRLFVDTTALTTLAYAYYYFGKASQALIDTFTKSLYRYSLYILCAPDIPFEDSWDRSGPGSREKLHQICLDLLQEHKLKYCQIGGTLSERVASVKIIMEENKL